MTENNSVICKLGDLFEFQYGKSLPKDKRREDGKFPVYGSNGIVGYHNEYLVEGPAIIVGRKGAAGEITFENNNLWPIDTTYFIRVSEEFNFKFSYFLLKSLNLQQYDKSTAIPGLNRNDAYNIVIKLPNLPEQRAIASKIEQLFSELDNGIANLKQAQEQLKVYRQAVLNKAFEGELTKAWREEHQHEIESALQLLEQIRQERKRILGNTALSKKNTDNEPASIPDVSIPEDWIWITPKVIASPHDSYALSIGPFGSNLKVSDYRDSGVPLIFVKNIRTGSFQNFDTKYVTDEKAEELRPHHVESGDILITKMGEPPGDATLYPPNHPKAIITADCVKFRLTPLLEERKFFIYLINSSLIKNQIIQITKGVAQKKISLERFRGIAIPFPSRDEQHAIVTEIETRLSVCEKVDQDITEHWKNLRLSVNPF